MGPPLTFRTAARTAASQIGTGRYTEGFAAILAEHAPGPMLAPVEVCRPARVRRELPSDDARHLPALKAAALGWLLLLSTGAASWYAIVDPIWSIPITLPSQVRTLSLIPPSTPSLWANGGEMLLIVS